MCESETEQDTAGPFGVQWPFCVLCFLFAGKGLASEAFPEYQRADSDSCGQVRECRNKGREVMQQ